MTQTTKWTNSLTAQAKRDLTMLRNAVRRFVPDEDRAYFTRLTNAVVRLEKFIDE